MKQGSTLFLRAVLVAAALIVLSLCIFAFPSMGRGMAAEFPSVKYLEYSILVGYVMAVPILIAFYQAWKLLGYIDNNTAFSESSVKALKNIKYCGVAVSVAFLCGMPFVVGIAEADDAPGAVVMGLIIAGAPLVISVFAAVLQKLLQNAIDIKSENDLTI
jgi:hypothetical protein